jgi:hypothetical protein
MKEERKKLLHLPISMSIYKDFMSFVQKKRGYYKKGDLSKYTEIAYGNLMAEDMQQQQSTKNIQIAQKRVMRVAKRWKEASVYLYEKYGVETEKGKTLPRKLLQEAIGLHHDDRTVDGWIDKFVGHGYITPSSDNLLAFEILKPGFTVTKLDKKELR